MVVLKGEKRRKTGFKYSKQDIPQYMEQFSYIDKTKKASKTLYFSIIIGWLPLLFMIFSMVNVVGHGNIVEKFFAGRDFGTFWVAGRMAWHSIADSIATGAIFTPGFFSTELKHHFDFLHGVRLWSYPPTGLFLVLPFSILNIYFSWIIFSLSGLAIFFATMKKTGFWWIGLFAVPAIWDNILAGQNGLFTSSLAILGFYYAMKQDWKSGLCFGAMTFKPQLGLIVPGFLIANKSWKIIFIAGVSAIILAALSALMWPGSWHEWFARVVPVQSQLMDKPIKPTAIQAYTASPFIFFRWFGISVKQAFAIQMAISAFAFVLAMFVGYYSKLFDQKIDKYRMIVLLLCLEAIAAPYILDYDLAALSCLTAVGLWQGWIGNGIYSGLEKVFGYTLLWLPGWNLVLGIGLKIPSVVWLDIFCLATALMADLYLKVKVATCVGETEKEPSKC